MEEFRTQDIHKAKNNQQEELRRRLLEYLVSKPMSIWGLARLLKVQYVTLNNFLTGRRKVYSVTWKKLEDFLNNNDPQ